MNLHQREITIWFNDELGNRLSATLRLQALLSQTFLHQSFTKFDCTRITQRVEKI